MTPEIRVGSIVYGFAGGLFGRDDYEDKRVEVVAHDYVILRPLSSYDTRPRIYTGDPNDLLPYTEPPDDDW